jgi:hypothetical protein
LVEQGEAVAGALRDEWARLDRAVGDIGTTATGEKKK